MGKTDVGKAREKKYFSRFNKPLVALPNLVSAQTDSFAWLIEKGLKEIFDEFNPIADYSGKKFELEFTHFEISAPKYDENHAKDDRYACLCSHLIFSFFSFHSGIQRAAQIGYCVPFV